MFLKYMTWSIIFLLFFFLYNVHFSTDQNDKNPFITDNGQFTISEKRMKKFFLKKIKKNGEKKKKVKNKKP